MEKLDYFIDENHQNKIHDSSKLSINLRKKKMNQILKESRPLIEESLTRHEKESDNMSKLCFLSKTLANQKDVENLINILDKIYFFLINLNIPLKPNFIKLSSIIPYLFNKISLFETNETMLLKIYDVLEEILKFFHPIDMNDECFSMFNEQYFQLTYKLIELYQNNEQVMKKILNCLSILIEKSNYIKRYLMTVPGCYFIQSILSLDELYPDNIINLIGSFCNYENLNDETMKEFEIILIKESDKMISLFYKTNKTEPNIVINNSNLFFKLYSCFDFVSVSSLNEVLDVFFSYDKANEVNLYEKIFNFEKYNRELLAPKVLGMLTNLYCSSNQKHIQNLIENNSYKYVMERLLDKFSNQKIHKEASCALANFVNTPEYREIFFKNNYLNDIINKLRESCSYDVTGNLLIIISNIIYAIDEIEILSFINSDIIPLCIELLKEIKEPYLLVKILKIIEMFLYKGDPNTYLSKYYKDSKDKIPNPFKYQFDFYDFYDILSNILLNNKSITVYESATIILKKYYDKE